LEVCGGDQIMADTLQLAVGGAAFGDNRHHRVEILCGDGGTGKSTFAETVGTALGTYSHVLPASVLNSRTDQHPTGIAGLVGKRFVTVPEVTGGTFRSETLKALSGEDSVSARFMRQDFFTFHPVCSLWLLTNDPPAVGMVDQAVRRRFRIWPFDAQPDAPDPKLAERLQSPNILGGVLRWIVDGAACFDRLSGEFPDCEAVKRATAQYFEENDTVGSWLAARCETTEEAETRAGVLFENYVKWCNMEGKNPVTRTAWGTYMGRRVRKRHTRRGNVYAIRIMGKRQFDLMRYTDAVNGVKG
ncbi:MAG: phage/plasmid primase, P4 family, partial [Chloroflexota bacterium]|nr:phage/plasmid primase, P4 family [Chloroflexota bacterium]